MPPGERKKKSAQMYKDCENYNEDCAPCICVSGHGKHAGDHELLHTDFDPKENAHKTPDGKAGTWTYAQARDDAAKSASDVLGCEEGCVKAQLDEYHKEQAKPIHDGTVLRADSAGRSGRPNIPMSNTAASTASF
jgi:hypothetical protein